MPGSGKKTFSGQETNSFVHANTEYLLDSASSQRKAAQGYQASYKADMLRDLPHKEDKKEYYRNNDKAKRNQQMASTLNHLRTDHRS